MVLGTTNTALVRQAFRLEWFTAAWMVIEAGVAFGSGIAAASLTLIAFGADSIVELLSAILLLWRLSVELRHGEEFSESIERRASKFGAILLGALVLYILASASWGLWTRHAQENSLPGLVLAVVAIPVMYLLARAKTRIAEAIGSRALRTDAVQSVTCGYLSAIVVFGLIAQMVFGVWWIDSVCALALVPFLVHEAREAWEE